MPPPPKKKLKISASSSEGHALSLELISHIASYANIGNGDALTICLAVGPKDANAIRHFCLHNNMDYLEDRLERYDDEELTEDQVATCVKAWMDVNTDWKKHVTDENIKKYEIVQRKSSAEDDDVMLDIDALAIFNNPLVAIEFDLLEPLRHLVEEVGIDINSNVTWNSYTEIDKWHPLAIAMMQKNLSCFQYLLTRENLDVNGKVETVEGETMAQIMQYAFCSDEVSLASYEAMASHSSFDANRPVIAHVEGVDTPVLPLQHAINSITENNDDSDLDKMEEKLMSLLNKFKAHPLSTTPDFPYPAILFADIHRRRQGDITTRSRISRIYWAMMEALTEDEQETWRRTHIDAFNINDGDGGNSDGDDDGDGDGDGDDGDND